MTTGLQINLEFDSNAMAAPESFRDDVQAAAAALEAVIDDPITVNIDVGYGEYDLGGPEYTPLNSGESLGGLGDGIPVSYSLLRAALLQSATNSSETAAIEALPNTVALNGQSQFYLSAGEAKALGIISATGTEVDGFVGFPTSFSGDTLTSAAITELAHALGLDNGSFPESLFEYTSPGTHFLAGGTTSTPVYFSLDGGNTALAYYDATFDSTLFENVPDDPLAAPITGATSLTALDLSELGVLGFDVTSTTPPPSPTITPTASAAGSVPVVTVVQNVTVAENEAIPVADLITSVSVAAGDSIASYAFEDQGTGNGYFSIDGLAEPDDQWIDVLPTQLDSFEYVGGLAPGSEQLGVYAFDFTSDVNSYEAFLTATTTTAVLANTTPANFYDNGASAIPLQNTDGQIYLLQEAGSGGNVGNYGSAWQMIDADTFYTDGNSDIVLQNTDGQIFLLDMQGNTVAGYGNVGNYGADWTVVGSGDFFSDGDKGLVVQNTDGQIFLFDMQGNTVAGYSNVGNYGSDWQVVATGSFYGDGNTDLVLQETSGDIYLLDINNGVVGGGNVGNFGADWRVVGAGNFSTGLTNDLVLQNTDGQIELAQMEDNDVIGFDDVGNFGSAWQVKEVGDFFGDGHDGLALQNASGQIYLMELNGASITQSANLGNYGASWHIPLLPG